MDKIMEQIIALLIQNFADIGTAGTLVFLIYYIVNQHGKSNSREDDFRSELLKVHSRHVDISSQNNELLAKHTEEAKSRYLEQQQRNMEQQAFTKQQTEAMNKMVSYLTVIGETKSTVDSIQSLAIHTQGSVADLGTDITGLIQRRTDDVNQHVDSLKQALEQSLELVENAIKKMQPRIDGIADIQETHVEAQGLRHSELITEIRSMASALGTINVVMESAYQLLERLQSQIVPVAISPDTIPIPELQLPEDSSSDDAA